MGKTGIFFHLIKFRVYCLFQGLRQPVANFLDIFLLIYWPWPTKAENVEREINRFLFG